MTTKMSTVTESNVIDDGQGQLLCELRIGDTQFRLSFIDVGLGDRRRRLEVWHEGTPNGGGHASVSEANPVRRSVRRGLEVTTGESTAIVRKGSGLRWTHLHVAGDEIQWRVERERGGVRISQQSEALFVSAGTDSVYLSEGLSPDETALCVALWKADVAETLAWWYWLQFF